MTEAKNKFSNVDVFTLAVVGPASVVFFFGGAIMLGTATSTDDHVLGLLGMILGGGALVALCRKFADRIN